MYMITLKSNLNLCKNTTNSVKILKTQKFDHLKKLDLPFREALFWSIKTLFIIVFPTPLFWVKL